MHILVAAMEVLGMQTIANPPSEMLIPPNILEKNQKGKYSTMWLVLSSTHNYVDISAAKYEVATPDPDADSNKVSSGHGQIRHATNSDVKKR